MSSVDIIIPNYNYARYLPDCIESVLRQQGVELRVIVIDNASTDDSVAVVRAIMDRDDRVDLIVHEKNVGPHASFNEAIDVAGGTYMMILCSDDILLPDTLKRACAVLDNDQSLVVALGTERHEQDRLGLSYGLVPEPDTPWRLSAGTEYIDRVCADPATPIACGTMLVRTAAHKRAGYFRSELGYTDDLEMLLRIALTGGVAETRSCHGIRRLHTSNMSQEFTRAKSEELEQRRKAFVSFFARDGRHMKNRVALMRSVDRKLAERAYWWAVSALRRRDASQCRALLSYAVWLRPSMAFMPPLGLPLRMATTAVKTTLGPTRTQEVR